MRRKKRARHLDWPATPTIRRSTRKLHQTIAAVGANIESLAFNKAVANIYELANAIEKAAPSHRRAQTAVATMMRLVAPMVPHAAEEAWAAAGDEGMIADAAWPEVDPALLVEDEVTIAVQVNGKLRDTLSAPEGRRSRGAGGDGARLGQGRAQPRGQAAPQGDRRARPPRERRRMKRLAILIAAALLLAGCGLRPLYSGGARGAVATTLESVAVAPIQGRAGWLVRTALEDRLGTSESDAPRFRLEIQLDDDITGFGIRSDDAVTRERRSLRARYRLVDAARGTVLLDATAGADSGVDVVSSEYATVAAEQTALERLAVELADRIVARVALYAARTPTP